jgi:hypothetical protein
MIHVIVAATVYSRLAKAWRVVDWGPNRILLLALHDLECGGITLRHCSEAVVWTEGAFRSVRAPIE